MGSTRVSSFVAGVLVANSAPHLATAVTGRRHLTPLAGRNSGPAVNAVWGGVNLIGGLALLARSHRGGGPHWGGELVAFEAGCLALAAWMAGTERVFQPNSAP
ncbi:hypothetical protein F4561_006107 [Lipingzhangella halophila]|uniref:Uncharacterized protein n=1 Tax=Lipingzhangella halophila TaxID=1783352 RepID=A0A7W7RPF0_9ACTN|nr:hypothetical protein [Lipingzhangella halophila]MBB4935213.1 hypothetical protein [Lipingzhangella halophila]